MQRLVSGISSPSQTVGGIKAEVSDREIGRYRPMIIVNEEITTAEGAALRGKWERQREHWPLQFCRVHRRWVASA
ncbi:hypothetical protein ACT691_12195 [Vibrio metschnikovii]